MTMDPTCGDIRLVSWDVDGTLYSFAHILRAIAKYRRSTFKGPEWMETGRNLVRIWNFQKTVEHPRRDSDCRVIGSDLERFSETRLQVREVLRRMLGKIRPQSGALDLLGRFAQSGIPHDFNCRYKLDALEIACYFDDTYVSEDIGVGSRLQSLYSKSKETSGSIPKTISTSVTVGIPMERRV